MAINLTRFVKNETVIMPLIGGWGVTTVGRKLYFTIKANQKTKDNWYEIQLSDVPKIIKPASPLQIRKVLADKKGYKFYALGNEGIPIGKTDSVPIHFLSARPFEVVEAIQWEDKRWYLKSIDTRFQRRVRTQVQEAFEKEQPLDGIKHIVPELRYVYVILNLQRQSIKQARELEKFALQEKEKRKRLLEFQSTFSGRLSKILEEAGAKLVRWEKRGNNYLVTWITGGQTIKSIVTDSFQIISGGFCLSGWDSVHTISSITQLAKIYMKEDTLNITRI